MIRLGIIHLGGAGWIGGSEYIRNLVLALARLPAAERAGYEVHLLSGTALPAPLAAELQPHVTRLHDLARDLAAPTLPRRLRWRAAQALRGDKNARFGEFLAAQNFDFLYPLTYDNRNNLGVALPLAPTLGARRWAGWIPDFQHRYLPEYLTARALAQREADIATLVGEARTLIFSSASAEADFRRFYPAAQVRTEVLHFHTNAPPAWFDGDPLAVQRQFHLPDRFLLVSNQFWQHKNHGVLLAALALLRAPGTVVEVVCTGHPSDYRNADYFNGLLRRIHELGLAPQVHLLGLIERAEQIQLMRRCLAVVQPSLFEGWSTVLEDARALGRPVIASDLEVHREQQPPGVRFFARTSPEDLAAVLAERLPELEPGPDLSAEAAARAAAEQAVLGYGRRFLEIVRGCLA